MKRIFLIAIIACSVITAQNEIVRDGKNIYLSNTVVVKLKPEFAGEPQSLNYLISNNVKNLSVLSVKKTFDNGRTALNKGGDNLAGIYTVIIGNKTNPFEAAKKISLLKQVEWAEPKYVRTIVSDASNDSLYVLGKQNNLNVIKAPEAWNVSHGDSNVIVAIIDTGIDWNHPDIEANIYKVNGQKVGWDFGGLDGTPDADPTEDKTPDLFGRGYHGTHVAGIASGVTNNSIGIASVGYNCSLLPVKVTRSDRRNSDGNPFVIYGFEGIKYAADNGAKVINCSFAGPSSSRFEQEIINYALNKGALVVASAGNENTDEPSYPASYEGVLCVGWTNNDDTKSSASNYGTRVDVVAPGSSIISTWPTLTGLLYNTIGGSSMSAPHVSGLAALVFSVYPDYSPLQVAERIRATSDDIYGINSSPNLKYLFGRGRINAFRALTETNPISVRATKVNFIDEGNGNGLLESGENVAVDILFTNYLSQAGNVKISLKCEDPAVEVLDSVFFAGNLNTLDTLKNLSQPFRFKVLQSEFYNHTVNFLMIFTANGYSDYQWISARVNTTYENINSNNLELTLTSKGVLGFNDYPDNFEGSGLKYKKQSNVLFEGAFMYGTSQDKLMDAARVRETQSADFKIVSPLKISSIGSESDIVGTAVFNDDGANTFKLGIETVMSAYSYGAAPNNDFIIVRTKLENKTQTDIFNLYAGYYFDFDIPSDSSNDYTDDMVGYDATDNFGYAYDFDGLPQKIFIGTALISDDKYAFYAINQDSTSAVVSPNSNDGFTDSEKWTSISSGISKTMAGPGDISLVAGSGPFDIKAGDKLDLAFVIACGEDLVNLKSAVSQSRKKWLEIYTDAKNDNIQLPTDFKLYQNYPNPFNPSTIINYNISSAGYVSLKVYDLLGREVAVLVNEFKQPGNYKITFDASRHNLSSGTYFYKLSSGNFTGTNKMLYIK